MLNVLLEEVTILHKEIANKTASAEDVYKKSINQE